MTIKKNKPRSIFDDYETSIELEKDGAWVTTSRGYEFKIARIGEMNPEYRNFMIERGKVIHAEIEALGEKIDEKNSESDAKKLYELATKMDDVTIEAFARFILKGWRNLYDREGKEIPYSVDNAITLMQMHDLYNELYPLARQYSTFLVSNLETTAKN